VGNAIPTMFYLNGLLHKKRKIVQSDNSVVTWCYQKEKIIWYPRGEVRKNFKKAYAINVAASLMRVRPAVIREVFKKQMFKLPEQSYDLGNYRPLKEYINEEDMLELRQVVWDTLPKNRFGEPYDDRMTNELELIQLMKQEDDRQFTVYDDGELIQIFPA
jgi:hypothetical protein